MSVRGFDPQRSAALREELARRADAEGRAGGAPAAPRARGQLVIAGVVGAVLVAGTVGVLQQVPSRTPADPAAPAASPSSASTPAPDGADRTIVPASPAPGIRMPGIPLLRATGDGPQAFTFDVPVGVSAVQVWLTCPDGTAFSVRGATTIDGTCGSDPALTVLPVQQGPSDVRIEVADGVSYSLLVLRTPSGGSTFKTPPIRAPRDR